MLCFTVVKAESQHTSCSNGFLSISLIPYEISHCVEITATFQVECVNFMNAS